MASFWRLHRLPGGSYQWDVFSMRYAVAGSMLSCYAIWGAQKEGEWWSTCETKGMVIGKIINMSLGNGDMGIDWEYTLSKACGSNQEVIVFPKWMARKEKIRRQDTLAMTYGKKAPKMAALTSIGRPLKIRFYRSRIQEGFEFGRSVCQNLVSMKEPKEPQACGADRNRWRHNLDL